MSTIERRAPVLVLLLACGGMNPPPPVAPLPATVTGLPIFLAPGPTVATLDDPVARPLTVALQHDIRDVLEEAGFKLVDSEALAGGFVATLSVQRAGRIRADMFIHGAEACGVRLDIKRAGAVIATAEPDAPCVSTSTYYGMLSKDAVITMLNVATRAPAFIAASAAWRTSPTAPDASAAHPEERPQETLHM
jgi:hypothetical protein